MGTVGTVGRAATTLLAVGLLYAVIWIGRLRNLLGDAGLDGSGRAVRAAIAVAFLVAACTLVLAGLRVRRVGVDTTTSAVVLAIAALASAYWVVRGVGILADPGHATGFKIVHTVLMVVSLAAAGALARVALAGRTARADRADPVGR